MRNTEKLGVKWSKVGSNDWKSRGSASLLNNLWTLWTLWTNVPSVYFFRKVSMFFRKITKGIVVVKIILRILFLYLHISKIVCIFAGENVCAYIELSNKSNFFYFLKRYQRTQDGMDRWIRYYNYQRPHQGYGSNLL